MELVALHGPTYSGKTTLADALVEQGYQKINFTDLLKSLLAMSLTSIGVPVTVEDILNDKAHYRPLLQEFGQVIGFDDDPKYVRMALEHWGGGLAVFDNVRTLAQFYELYALGFKLVKLNLSEADQFKRARARFGLTLLEFRQMKHHPIETPIPDEWLELSLDAERPTAALVDEIVHYGDVSGEDVIVEARYV